MMRIGHGYDVHAFADEAGDIYLGGVPIAHQRKLCAHSDGDVVLHALMDALLGAAALGDIGQMFPQTEERWRDAASSHMLTIVLEQVQKQGLSIGNVDLTVIAQEPQLSPHRAAIEMRIASLLSVPLDRISLKATTHEGLGALGRAEGIAAHALVLLE